MLNEAAAHLRDSAAALEREGMDPESAQSAAIAAFGDGPTITKAANRRSLAVLLTAFVRAAAQLAVYGFVAIGVGALLARGLALVTSTQWVYGAPASYSFIAAQCTHWFAVQPNAANCRAVEAMESSDNSFLFILAAAVIGSVRQRSSVPVSLSWRPGAPTGSPASCGGRASSTPTERWCSSSDSCSSSGSC
jgi:hypothetical protein